MRPTIVFGLLLVLLAGLTGLLVARDHPNHQAPAAPVACASASASAVVPAARASASASASATADAGPLKLMDRALRAVTLGWDLAAAGVLANGGLDPAANSDFTAAGLEVHLRPMDTMRGIEGALARGGADKDGADIAVVPLPELVASYERLRALNPEVFFVVGWSRGREALVSTQPALPVLPDRPPAADAGPPTVSMVGAAFDSASFLGLYALDESGVPPSAVRLVAPSEAKPEDPALAAVDRGMPGDSARRNILLTTADASRLLPFVAVAQRGLVEKHGPALTAWARVWLEASTKLQDDAPAAARRIAGAAGAPEPQALLMRLGDMGPSTLSDNARVVGLSGRGALTLEGLFQKAWSIWRAAGALATPAPETAPIQSSVIAALVRSSPSLLTPPAPAKAKGGATDALRVMVTSRQAEGKLDEGALLAETAMLASVFERSTLRVSVLKGANVDAAATKRLIEAVEQRYDIGGGRLTPGKKAAAKAAATIEVLAAP